MGRETDSRIAVMTESGTGFGTETETETETETGTGTGFIAGPTAQRRRLMAGAVTLPPLRLGFPRAAGTGTLPSISPGPSFRRTAIAMAN
jgi:hypothetical protein